MEAAFHQTEADKWEWQNGAKFYSVRLFPRQGTLIWAGWTNSIEGPRFDSGMSQSIDDFLTHGPVNHAAPEALVEAIRAAIEQEHNNSRGFRLFGKRLR